MRRVRFYVLLLAGMVVPQVLAATHFLGWMATHGQRALGWSVPGLLLSLNVPLFIEAVRRKRRSLLPQGVTGLVLQVWTAWWLGSFLYALVLAVFAPIAGLVGLVRGAPLELPLALAVLPFVLATYGALLGSSLLRREVVQVPVRGLARTLRGLRIVQLSDLHSGRHISRRRLQRIAQRAARLSPDVVVVTGDIVHNAPQFAQQAAEAIASIPAHLGHFACLGNHDFWAGADRVEAALQKAGVQVLRNRGVLLGPKDGDKLWLCGVDDVWSDRFDLEAALRGRPANAPVVLLSHQPNTWPLAQKAGIELQLSGHTHGGQVALLWLHRSLSLARFITPFVAGLYRAGQSFLYVNRGAGSVVPMVRLGARPEVTELTLVDAGENADAPDAIDDALEVEPA
ncbi:MAG: metallophosphoesterase [Deltaproteobacteria bacterium]|nr:metallophosphoesterase [Deltaproteobacteria bacterium]